MRIALASLALVALWGCGSPSEKICGRFAELYQEDVGKEPPKELADKCSSEVEAELQQCPDIQDEVVACYKEASSVKDFGSCSERCKGNSGDADKPSAAAKPAAAGKGEFPGCPGSEECVNGCKDKCETAHGKLINASKMAACARSGGDPEDCVDKATNEAARQCFLKCRGL